MARVNHALAHPQSTAARLRTQCGNGERTLSRTLNHKSRCKKCHRSDKDTTQAPRQSLSLSGYAHFRDSRAHASRAAPRQQQQQQQQQQQRWRAAAAAAATAHGTALHSTRTCTGRWHVTGLQGFCKVRTRPLRRARPRRCRACCCKTAAASSCAPHSAACSGPAALRAAARLKHRAPFKK